MIQLSMLTAHRDLAERDPVKQLPGGVAALSGTYDITIHNSGASAQQGTMTLKFRGGKPPSDVEGQLTMPPGSIVPGGMLSWGEYDERYGTLWIGTGTWSAGSLLFVTFYPSCFRFRGGWSFGGVAGPTTGGLLEAAKCEEEDPA